MLTKGNVNGQVACPESVGRGGTCGKAAIRSALAKTIESRTAKMEIPWYLATSSEKRPRI
jgi:hypothetical protein